MNVVAQDYQDKNFSEMFIDCMVEIMFCMIWLYPKKACIWQSSSDYEMAADFNIRRCLFSGLADSPATWQNLCLNAIL